MTMESWHVVGQKVTPKDKRPWADFHQIGSSREPQFGEVYEIEDVYIDGYDDIMFSLVGMPDDYTAHSFRPVRETSIECFRSLLSPTPEQVRELEDA